MRAAWILAAALASGCALTPETSERLMRAGQAMQGAGNAMQGMQGTPASHTYILNGRAVTCTTTNNVTNCQ